MNYYKRHIGDYAAATRHLTMLEHGAYTLLLDTYYTTEAPLPADLKAAARKAGARSKEEVAAVETVLPEFFTLTDRGWIQQRCDAEIEAYHAKAETNRVVGKKGGRPRKTTQTDTGSLDSGNPEKTQTVSENNPDETLTTNHKPITNNQYPPNPPAGSSGVAPDGAGGVEPVFPDLVDLDPAGQPAAGVACTTAGAACLALKAAGIADTNPSSPKLRALLDAGADLQEFIGAAQAAVAAGNGRFAYVLAAMAGERERAAKLASQLHQGALPAAETAYQRAQRERVQEFAPSLARQAPEQRQAAPSNQSAVEFFNTIEVPARTVGAIE